MGRNVTIAVAGALLAMGEPLPAQAPPATDSHEMRAIFEADQAPRTNTGATIDWSVVGPQDETRRTRTRALLEAGKLRTVADYYRAAVVFQHGITADEILLAHVLAVAATARGHPEGPWMAAASLDRYLQKTGQPQIYGTQFLTPDRQNTTQEPYNRRLVPDSLRTALGVSTQAEQESRRQEIQARYRAAPRPGN